MRGDSPDPERLSEIADELENYRLTRAEGPVSRLTVFGEMASVLSLRGNSAASVEVERNWTRLTHHLPHFTLCAYASDGFDDEIHADLFANVCAEHWAVSHA